MSDEPTKTASSHEESKPISETITKAVNAATSSVGAVLPSEETVKSTVETVQSNISSAIPSTEQVKSGIETAQAQVAAAVPGTEEAKSSNEKPGISNLRTQQEYDNAVSDKSSLLVVDFYATWCGPCKVIAPQVVKFTQKYPNVRFFNLDVDDLPALSKELNVRAMPTFVLYKGGEKVAVVVGANPKALEAAIKANLDGEGDAPINGNAETKVEATNGTKPETKAEPAKPATAESDMEAALKAEFEGGGAPTSF